MGAGVEGGRVSVLGLSRKRVAKNAASQIVAFAISGLTKGIAAVMVARSLGPDGLGLFSLAWTLTGTLAIFAVLGLDYRLIRELSRTKSTEELEASVPLACVLSLTCAAIVAAVPLLAHATQATLKTLEATSIYIAVSGPVVMLRAAFHSRERMELETFTLAVEGAVGLSCVIAALSLGLGVFGAVVSLAIGRIANLVVSFWMFGKIFGRLHVSWQPRRWPRMLRLALPIGISYAFTTVYLRFDILLLAAMRPHAEVGIYSAGSVIILTVPVITNSLNGSLYPVLARAESLDHPELRDVFHRTARFLILAGLPAAAGLSVIAHPLMKALYGAKFADSAWVLALLAWVLPLRFINNLMGVVLTAIDKQSKRTIAVMIAALVNLISNLILIPAYGYRGAVYSTLGTEVVLSAVLVWGILPLRLRWVRATFESAAAAALVAIVAMVAPGGVIGQTLAGACAFFVAASCAIWLTSDKRRTRKSTSVAMASMESMLS